jgi:nucleotide-binding universal stress UspA family protein
MELPPFRKPIRQAMNSARSSLRIRRILVPVDFLAATVTALKCAAAFAHEFKATITLLHVIRPDGSHVRRNISKDRLIDEMVEMGECRLRKLVDVIWGDAIATDIVVASGKPYVQIVNEAKETNADVIIIASHGAVGSWGFFRRGTVAKVVRSAPCPVLVVPLFGRGFAVDAPVETGSGR